MGEKKIICFLDAGSYKLKGMLLALTPSTQTLETIDYHTSRVQELVDDSMLEEQHYATQVDSFLMKLKTASQLLTGQEIHRFFINIKAQTTSTDIIEDEVTLSGATQTISAAFLNKLQERHAKASASKWDTLVGGSFWNISVDGVHLLDYTNYSFHHNFRYRLSLFHTQHEKRVAAIFALMKPYNSKMSCSLNTTTISKLLLKEREMQQGAILIDIGEKTTEVSLYRFHKLLFITTLPVGGYHLTKDIQSLLKINFEQAEQLKLEYSSYLKVDGTKLLIEFAYQGLHEEQQKLVIEKKYLEAIMTSRIEDIFELAIKALREAGFAYEKIEHYIFTGGTAEFEKMLDISERYFNQPKVKKMRVTNKSEWKLLNTQESSALIGMSVEYASLLEEQLIETTIQEATQQVAQGLGAVEGLKVVKVKKKEKAPKEVKEGVFSKIKHGIEKMFKEVF